MHHIDSPACGWSPKVSWLAQQLEYSMTSSQRPQLLTSGQGIPQGCSQCCTNFKITAQRRYCVVPVWARCGSLPLVCKHMQPVNPKGCMAEVMWGPLQHIPLQVACIIVDDHAGRCKQHAHEWGVLQKSDSFDSSKTSLSHRNQSNHVAGHSNEHHTFFEACV